MDNDQVDRQIQDLDSGYNNLTEGIELAGDGGQKPQSDIPFYHSFTNAITWEKIDFTIANFFMVAFLVILLSVTFVSIKSVRSKTQVDTQAQVNTETTTKSHNTNSITTDTIQITLPESYNLEVITNNNSNLILELDGQLILIEDFETNDFHTKELIETITPDIQVHCEHTSQINQVTTCPTFKDITYLRDLDYLAEVYQLDPDVDTEISQFIVRNQASPGTGIIISAPETKTVKRIINHLEFTN